MPLLIIGDVHGKLGTYLDILDRYRKFDSLQIGDLGFGQDYDVLHREINTEQNRFVPGNHDDYDWLENNTWSSLSLGDWGMAKHGNIDFFFVRGGFSIDRQHRKAGVSWWPQEELDEQQMDECFESYLETKPDIVISHDCPSGIYPFVTRYDFVVDGSRTKHFLQRLYKAHKPTLWIFGHHHITKMIPTNPTTFQCLGELSHGILDIDSSGFPSFQLLRSTHSPSHNL
jgi:hypothetical protein